MALCSLAAAEKLNGGNFVVDESGARVNTLDHDETSTKQSQKTCLRTVKQSQKTCLRTVLSPFLREFRPQKHSMEAVNSQWRS